MSLETGASLGLQKYSWWLESDVFGNIFGGTFNINSVK